MRVGDYLAYAEKKLADASIGSARLDVLILLEDELNRDRAAILARPERKLAEGARARLDKRLSRRAKHEPLAYIRGFSDFYGRRFKVNHRVLEPRPESETMVELLVKLAGGDRGAAKWKIVDVGCGSGAIGITAALELHNHGVDLYDIDAAALAVTKHNCAFHELHLRTVKRDLLRATHKRYDVILANLPYVPDSWKINEAAAMEPRHAIFGGNDGLDFYRRLFEQLSHFSWKPIFIFTESLPPQHKSLAQIAVQAGFKQINKQDFIQVFEPVTNLGAPRLK